MQSPADAARARRRPSARPGYAGDIAGIVAVAVVAIVAIGTGLVGRRLVEDGVRLHLADGLLLRGPFEPAVSVWVVAPVAVALVVLAARRWWRQGPWAWVLATGWLGSLGWAVTLAGVRDGLSWQVLARPLTLRHEYLYDVPRVNGLGELLSSYVQHVSAQDADPWTTHVGGHPPGALAFFAGLEAIGLGGPVWAGLACIVAGSAAVPAVLIAVRACGDQEAARRVAPFLVLAPWAMWVATSADALWTGTLAWAFAALTGAGRSRVLAVTAGLLAGLAAFGSYGVAPLGLLGLAIVAHQGTWRRIGWVASGALAPLLAAGAAGFWWWQGLHATALRVADGPSWHNRPYAYFVVAGLVVAAFAVGPAVVAALPGVLRRPETRVLVLPVLVAIVIVDVTGMTKGEVERIWLPFYPWLTVAVAALAPRRTGWWLAATAAWALLMQICVMTEW